MAEILRGDTLLLQRLVPASGLAGRDLAWRAERLGARLTVGVGAEAPFEFDDFFPSAMADSAAIALEWPGTAPLMSWRVFRRKVSEASSPLQKADNLLAAARYQEAETLYAATLQRLADDDTLRHEARYRLGLCQARLGRTTAAMETWRSLLLADDPVWSPIAGCQLLLLLLEQTKDKDAGEVFDLLAGRYKFEAFVRHVAVADRHRIVDHFTAEFSRPHQLLRYDPLRRQRLDRALKIDRLMSPTGFGRPATQLYMVRALRFEGRTAEAANLCKQIVDRTHDGMAYRNYLRLLRQTGRPEKTLQLADQLLHDPPQGMWLPQGILHIERAIALAQMGNDAELERELSWFFTAEAPKSYMWTPAAWLLRGLLFERRGDQRRRPASVA